MGRGGKEAAAHRPAGRCRVVIYGNKGRVLLISVIPDTTYLNIFHIISFIMKI